MNFEAWWDDNITALRTLTAEQRETVHTWARLAWRQAASEAATQVLEFAKKQINDL
jgi:hypothetical protein